MWYFRLSAFVVTAMLMSGACAGPESAPPHATSAQSGAQAGSTQAPDPGTRVLDLGALSDMSDLLDRIADRRVVFVGESHDRYEDHLNQLAVIEGLHARGKSLAIGMEFFQQPYQAAIDAYVAGEIDEAEFLRRTEYFDRWRFDYRLYRPILRFAREHGIPVIALNLEAELTAACRRGRHRGSDRGRACAHPGRDRSQRPDLPRAHRGGLRDAPDRAQAGC